MTISSLKVLLFLAAGVVAAGAATYATGVLDPWLKGEEKVELAALPPEPEPAAPQVDENRSVPVPEAVEPGAAAQDEPEADETPAAAQDEPARDVVVPSFDLVRVEPDGSMVIAGRAAGSAAVEIVSGSSVIGAANANAGGEFAIVLDDPLKPGDYTLVLRSTSPENVVATSLETAIVSVPAETTGEVLALVEQPGQPSRLITVPTGPKADRPGSRDADADAEQPAELAVEEPVDDQNLAGAPVEETSPESDRQAAAEGEPAADEAAGEDVAEAPDSAAPAEDDVADAPAQPAADDDVAEAPAPPVADEDAAPGEVATDEPAAPASEPQADEQIAAVDEDPAPEPAPAPVEQRVAVEAVEIEGDTVFVAGRAEPGARVRVYANDILLGDSEVSDGGRFLVEANRDLPVGDYIVRADMLGSGGQVIARAAVPFEREPGESVAAVAGPAQQPADEPAAMAASGDDAADDVASGEPAAVASGEPASGADSAADVIADAEPAATNPATTDPAAGEMAAEQAPDEQIADEQIADARAAQDERAVAMAGDEADDEVAEIVSPKLQNVGGAVIIRRGDTLWQLSRRVYGRGVRYTTIYLANQDQIADPDRIWPGQVFSVPGETDDGEQADLSAVADQVSDQAETETR